MERFVLGRSRPPADLLLISEEDVLRHFTHLSRFHDFTNWLASMTWRKRQTLLGDGKMEDNVSHDSGFSTLEQLTEVLGTLLQIKSVDHYRLAKKEKTQLPLALPLTAPAEPAQPTDFQLVIFKNVAAIKLASKRRQDVARHRWAGCQRS